MVKKFSIFAVFCLLMLSSGITNMAAAQTPSYDGKLVKMDGLSTLYYVMEGKRYVFPNEKTFNSWFIDFNDVTTLAAEQIYILPLAGNVLYRPGIIMVKVTTDPKVYVVAKGGELRWVKTEALAKKLYGDDWNLLIDDLPDAFFTNYHIGNAIENESDFDPDTEADGNDSIERNHGKALGHAKKASTIKCRAIPAIPAKPGHKNSTTTPATPAIPARICKNSHSNDGTSTPATLSISNVVALYNATTTTATITWKTNLSASSKVDYSTESLASSTDIDTVSDSANVLSHSIDLTGLTASSTYYYRVYSTTADNKSATSSEYSFFTTPVLP